MPSDDYPPFDQAALATLSDYGARPAPLCPWGCRSDDPALQAWVPRPAHAWDRQRLACPVCCRTFTVVLWWQQGEDGEYRRHLEFTPGRSCGRGRQSDVG